MLAINLDLTAEQRLHKSVVSIMSNPRYVAMAGLLMMGKRTIDETTPTACTNGRDEVYGRAFVDSLTDAELRFVVLHECKHKMYRHLITWKHLHDKDHRCANMACDYVINLEIEAENPDGFATMPLDENGKHVGLLDHRFRNMNSQEVFNIIYEEQEQGGGAGEGEGEGETLDSHDWDGAQEMSDGEKRQLEQEIDQAIRQGALTAGKMGADTPRGFEQLLQPQIDWREVMREFVSTTCTGKDYSTYNRPNRRFMSAGMYMPSAVSEQVGELVVAIDTSGSIGDTELAVFLSELKSICDTVNPSGVRLLYWGHEVVGDEKYGDMDTPIDQLVTSTKPQGGGGTDVNCVCNYIREENINAEAVVVLTDGYLAGDWGTWTQPLLWCILDNASANPSVGKYVNVTL
jgi:predicted metal-dependent peptidase